MNSADQYLLKSKSRPVFNPTKNQKSGMDEMIIKRILESGDYSQCWAYGKRVGDLTVGELGGLS